MATFSEMVDEVLLHLSGYGLRNDTVTYLTTAGGINSSATSFTVGASQKLGRGIVEIDDELIWADSYDSTTGTITVPPFGRGYLNTNASAHSVNTMVTANPTFSRQAVKNAINDTVRAVYPNLFCVSAMSFDFSSAITTYALPNNTEAVLSVRYQETGPSREWIHIKKFSVDKLADIDEFNSEKTLTIHSYVPSGNKIRVVYTSEPEILEGNTDDFALTTGLPESAKDVVILGAVHRLISMVEPGRLTFTAPAAALQSERISYGAGTNVAKYLYAVFQQRLGEEAAKLLRKYPIRIRYN